jgi:hypothetical protein
MPSLPEFRRLIDANPLSAVIFARACECASVLSIRAAQSARLPSSLSMKIIISCGGHFVSCCVKDVATSPVVQVQPSKVQTSIQKFFRRADGHQFAYSCPSAIQAPPRHKPAKLPTDKGSLHPANRNSQLISTVRTVTISISLLAADLNMSRPQHPVQYSTVQYSTTQQYSTTAPAPGQSSPAPSSSSRSFFLGPKLDRTKSLVFAHRCRPIYPTDPQLIFL